VGKRGARKDQKRKKTLKLINSTFCSFYVEIIFNICQRKKLTLESYALHQKERKEGRERRKECRRKEGRKEITS
jgi:hypothetical protein